MESGTMKAWQRGYELDELRAIAAIFKQHDEGLILGAFSAFKENSIAEALEAGRLLLGPDWAIDRETLTRPRPIRDFSGQVRARAEAGDLLVRRIAYCNGQDEALAGELGEMILAAPGRTWLQTWVEHPGDQAIIRALGLRWVCTKIKASSEMTGVYLAGGLGDQLIAEPPAPIPERDCVSLARLAEGLGTEAEALRAALDESDLSFADHYSGYNLRHSWSALALRGYGGDPEFIVKPSEMSKKWKRENAEALEWEIADTPLRERLPAAEPLIGALPGRPHRIRLMRLAPGGGELARHADITDPDAGTEIGQLMRLHFPIATNEDCVFQSWDLLGERQIERMRVGECWYLDTRKPHTAVNGGSSERLHLVIDMEVDEDLQATIDGPRG